MSKFAEPMARLIDELKKLPGIGSKTAQRLAFHILRSSDDDAEALAGAVPGVSEQFAPVPACHQTNRREPRVYCSNPTPQHTAGWLRVKPDHQSAGAAT